MPGQSRRLLPRGNALQTQETGDTDRTGSRRRTASRPFSPETEPLPVDPNDMSPRKIATFSPQNVYERAVPVK